MNILKKLTNKNLKLNKKRSITTIIGIIISTAMLCAVATMVTSFRQSLLDEVIERDGYYHLVINDQTKEDIRKIELNKEVESIYKLADLGDAEYKEAFYSPVPYLSIKSADKEDLKAIKFNLKEGRYPRDASEILVNEKLISDKVKIGDTLTLDVGQRVNGEGVPIDSYLYYQGEYLADTKTYTYKIVGTYTNGNYYYSSYAFTTGVDSSKTSVYLAFKNPKKYEEVIPGLLEMNSFMDAYRHTDPNKSYSISMELLRWEVFAFQGDFASMLYSVAGVVIFIIMVTSIFCIRNSFAISTTEKMKMYGMLASVGATKKQIKRSVIYEGLVLSLIGVPIGILSGLLGDYILFKVVNYIAGEHLFGLANMLHFKTSFVAIIIAAGLGFLTIYLSGLSSARKASKVSPIDNLRKAGDIKIKANKLKTPKMVEGIFKTGGVLAYKNLKRSKKKYRTTVISLTVSIFVFIAISAFINEGFVQSNNYYKDFDYNFRVSGATESLTKEKIQVIKGFNNIDEYYISYLLRDSYMNFDISKANYLGDSSFYSTCEDEENDDKTKCREFIYMDITILDDATFRSYAKKNKLNYDDVKDKAILYDTVMYYDNKAEKQKVDRRYTYKKGDVIELYDTDENKAFDLTIGAITENATYGHENEYNSFGAIYVNEKYYKNLEPAYSEILIESSNPAKLTEDIEKYDDSLHYSNLEEEIEAQRAMVLIISIFLYGFITLITLVGVTNIFNTITSNMDLRAKEFAMLKSVGMTKKEFNRMVNLETLFYSSKSLIYGIILGLLGSLAIHKAFAQNIEVKYSLPLGAIIIAIIFVFVLVYIIMRYSIRKINKQNTIETIRNENA